MDWQSLFNFVAGAGLLAMGWFCNTVYSAVKTLEKDLADHRVEDARVFNTRDAAHDMRNEFAVQVTAMRNDLTNGLQRIYDKLDGKADK